MTRRKHHRIRSAPKLVAVTAADTATPERLAKAQGHVAIGSDKVTRIRDGQIERLFDSGLLWRFHDEGRWKTDRAMSSHLLEAGRELQRVHHAAGLDASPTSVNLLAPGGGSGDKAHGIPTTEYAAGARVRLRNAHEAVIRGEPNETGWKMLLRIVVEDRRPVDMGDLVGPYGEKAVRTLAMQDLRRALWKLAVHWGHVRPRSAGRTEPRERPVDAGLRHAERIGDGEA